MTSQHRKIVVIEDDSTLREALRYNLVSEGYDAVTAEDGIDGLELARDGSPDLVLLDRDPAAADPEEIRGIRVLMTVVQGDVVWEA